MKRFLMLLAVAAVAGATYVATAPGSALHAGPTWKQYTTLKREFAALKKEVGQVKTIALSNNAFIGGCFLSTNGGAVPVGQFGDATAGTYGFQYYTSSTDLTGVKRGALDVDTSTTPQAWFQTVDPACINTGTAAHVQMHSSGRLPVRAERAR